MTTIQYKRVLDSLTDGITIQDRDFNIIYQNAAMQESLGDCIGEKCYAVYERRDQVCEKCGVQKAFQTGESNTVLRVAIEVNGNTSYWENACFPLFDDDGNIVAGVEVCRNVTDRVSLEEEVKDRNVELGQKNKQLTAINRELKDFAHIVSHDLKAPLRGIKILADWLMSDCWDKLDEENREKLQLLSSRVDRMRDLIDGILQYSRVGRIEQDRTAVDLGQTVAEIVANLSVPEHISIHIEDNLPTVEANPTGIVQVFQNLLSNAIKYMDKPQGEIHVGFVEEDGAWKFHVCDNGPGIEEEYFEQIFTLFQTLDCRDSRESTGVGLTIVKKIVELFGGRIWVESEVGQGSTFFFTLPRRPETAGCATQKLGDYDVAHVASAVAGLVMR